MQIYYRGQEIMKITKIPEIEGYKTNKNEIRKHTNNSAIWLHEITVAYIEGDKLNIMPTNFGLEYLEKLKAKLKNE